MQKRRQHSNIVSDMLHDWTGRIPLYPVDFSHHPVMASWSSCHFSINLFSSNSQLTNSQLHQTLSYHFYIFILFLFLSLSLLSSFLIFLSSFFISVSLFPFFCHVLFLLAVFVFFLTCFACLNFFDYSLVVLIVLFPLFLLI